MCRNKENLLCFMYVNPQLCCSRCTMHLACLFFPPQHFNNENLYFQFSQNKITALTHKLSNLRCDGNETSYLAPANTGQVICLSTGEGGK